MTWWIIGVSHFTYSEGAGQELDFSAQGNFRKEHRKRRVWVVFLQNRQAHDDGDHELTAPPELAHVSHSSDITC